MKQPAQAPRGAPAETQAAPPPGAGLAGHDVLAGGGEMGALMRSLDWGRTPLGPPERWPQSLRTVLSILLSSQHPIFLWWGPELVQFYNDGYRPILGATKHPAAMGNRGRETWREIWPVIAPMIQTVFAGGSTYVRDGLLILERNGFPEECYFNYAYSPVRDESGQVAGVFVACSESTDKVLGERRLKVLGALSASAVGATSAAGASAAAAAVLAEAAADLPFALVYLLDEGGRTARLTGSAGLAAGHPAAPAQVALEGGPWPLAAAQQQPAEVDLAALPGPLPGGPWPEPPGRARVLPLLGSGQALPFGFLVCGLSPRLPDDAPYRQFLQLAAGHLTTALANARGEEAKRLAHGERERLLREVEAGRNRLHSLFQNAPAFVCTLRGPEHVFEMVNPLYQQLVGAGRDVVGLPVREALPEVEGQGFLELLDGVYQRGEPFIGRELEVQIDRRGDGRLDDVFLNFVYQPRRGARGEVEGIDVFGFEVTEGVQARQRVEALAQQLRESEERLRRVVHVAQVGAWEVDLATEEVQADARFRELFGLGPAEPFPLSRGLALIHPEDRARVARAIQDALAGKDAGRYRTEYRTARFADGRPQWVEALGQVSFDAGGRPVRFLGTGLDITARKEVEHAQLRLLTAIADQPMLGVALLRGPQLVYELANALYLTVVGGRDVVGKPLLQALPELVGQGIDTLLLRVRETGEPYVGHELHVRLDRRGRGTEDAYFDLVFQAVRGASADDDGVLVLAHDVTEAVRSRGETQRQQQQHLDFEQQLIGIVSHDLRNPLAAIRLSAQTLLRGEELDARTTRAALRVQTSTERALRLVRDLLDFTRARVGSGIPVERRPLDLHALVRGVVEELEAAQPEREVQLSQEGDGQGEWDADRLAQVVENLVSNALKYSPADTPVQVRTRAEGETLVLQVHNVGAPIAPALLPRIFEPLQRATEEVDRQARSVGLGLYIVKHLVEAHGGSIEVQSTAEAGTTFRVRLPRG